MTDIEMEGCEDRECSFRAQRAKDRARKLFESDLALKTVSIYLGANIGMEMGITLTWLREDLMKEEK